MQTASDDHSRGDGDNVHPRDHATDVEPVRVEVVDQYWGAMNAGDAQHAQKKKSPDGFSVYAILIGIIGGTAQQPER